MERSEVLSEFEYRPESVSLSAVEESIRPHVKYSLAKPRGDLSTNDLLAAVALRRRWALASADQSFGGVDGLRHLDPSSSTFRDDLDALLKELLEESGGHLTDSERVRIDREAGWR